MDDKQKTNYGSNSFKSRQDSSTSLPAKVPEKKVERVVSGDVKVKKKGFLSKVKESLVSDDSSSVKSYVVNDVLIPSFKKAISDVITNGIDIILYGEARHTTKNNANSRISYSSYYNRGNEPRYEQRRSNYICDDIVVPSRAEAEKVLDVLCEAISQYGIASVADFYDAVGITSNQYTDYNYGWTNLSAAKTVPVRDGWVIVLPQPMPINN